MPNSCADLIAATRPRRGLNQRPCGSKSSSLTATLQAHYAPVLPWALNRSLDAWGKEGKPEWSAGPGRSSPLLRFLSARFWKGGHNLPYSSSLCKEKEKKKTQIRGELGRLFPWKDGGKFTREKMTLLCHFPSIRPITFLPLPSVFKIAHGNPNPWPGNPDPFLIPIT